MSVVVIMVMAFVAGRGYLRRRSVFGCGAHTKVKRRYQADACGYGNVMGSTQERKSF